MKSFILMIATALNFSVLADTVEKADALYGARGENMENATQAALIYETLAAKEAENMAKAALWIKQSRAIYYVAVKEDAKIIYKKAAVPAQAAAELFPEPETLEEEELKAKALYWYGTNVARTGSVINPRPAYKSVEIMKAIIEMGYEHIYDYGPYRVLGRIRHKAPDFLPLGSKEEAEVFLGKAFENTLVSEEVSVSRYGLNNLYYAQTLKARGKKSRGCEILGLFVRQDPEALNRDRIPETKDEIEEARAWIQESGC
ncbi:MAG: hypothetical protein OXB88_07520 [Bacteriovoracales bacterium]|nr:hypothetical protein [Bacteriovoracales bacterium]